MARLFARAGPYGAIVDGKFLKVREDGQREFGAPSVPAELKRGGGVHSYIDTAFLGLGVELWQRADTESVVRSLLLPFYIQTVLGDHFPILGRNHCVVADVPAEGFKEWID